MWPTSPATNPYGLDAAPDGSLWIALFGSNRLGRVNPATGALQLFTLPNAAARPRRLAVANDGRVWYTDYPRGRLGRLDPATGAVQEWVAPDPPPGPYGIALGTDGRVWFHAAGSNFMIAFDPLAAAFATVPIPTGGAIVRHMVADLARGDLWLALSGTGRIGRIRLVTPVVLFGAACPGSAGLPVFTAAGVPRIGTTIAFGVANTAAATGLLFAGLSNTSWNGVPLPLDLGSVGAPGCFAHVAPDFLLHAGAPGPVPVFIPVDPLLNGIVLHLQWALLADLSGPALATTQGATVTVMGI